MRNRAWATATTAFFGPRCRSTRRNRACRALCLARLAPAAASIRAVRSHRLLRFVLGQAGLIAAHAEVDLKRHYRTLLRRRGRPKAIVAIARKLLVRLYIMLRD